MKLRSTLPFYLCLAETDVVVLVGAGVIAAAKAQSLLETDAKIRVISISHSLAFNSLVTQHPGRFEFIKSDYSPEQLIGAKLVVVATNNSTLNEQVARDARSAGVLVNVVDSPELCDGYFPAIVRRGVIQIAIGTSGVSPMLARYVKRLIELALPSGITTLSKLFDLYKIKLRTISDPLKRRKLIDAILSGPIASAALANNISQAQTLLDQSLALAIQDHSAPQAALYLIGAGPGNPDLITLRAVELLSRAEVVLYDRLVAPEIIDRFTRKDAEKILVGKSRDSHFPQSKINALLREKLSQGLCVAHLKGGDPAIFARLTDELEVARDLGVALEIVPGVTAALGCAAYAGIPLTERGVAQSIRFVTHYQDETENSQEFVYKPSTNETLVYYMTGLYAVRALRRLMAQGCNVDTPVLLIERGTTAQQRIYSATLNEFCEQYANHNFESPSMIIVGEVTRWHATCGWFNLPENLVNQRMPDAA